MLIDKDRVLTEVHDAELWVSYSPDDPIEDIVEEAILKTKQAIADAIEDLSEVDAVEVLRCRDCQWYEIYQLKRDGTEDRRYRPSYCASLSYQTRPDWYCADGERRTNGEVTE